MYAVILAGGLSKRLGGVPKAGLMVDGETLLARTVHAAAQVIKAANLRDGGILGGVGGGPEDAHLRLGAQTGIAVVGPLENIDTWLDGAEESEKFCIAQEDPPFSGPAAGIAAGLEALDAQDGHVLVLACDMPKVEELALLLAAELTACAPEQGVMAVDAGRRQPLAAIYSVAQLWAATEAARTAHRLENASVFALVASVNIREYAVPLGLTADIDTWEDARAHSIVAPD